MWYRRGTGTLVLVPHVVQKGHRDSIVPHVLQKGHRDPRCATEGAQGP